jgi:hypothetical protein
MASLALLPKQVLRLPATRRAILSRIGKTPPLGATTPSFSTAGCSQQHHNTTAKLAASRTIVVSKRQVRLLSTSPTPRAAKATQEAPNAQAYLNSGAIAGARDLVDVKKVLVIGSGGLAIGQAGEFDYSGMSISCLFICFWRCFGAVESLVTHRQFSVTMESTPRFEMSTNRAVLLIDFTYRISSFKSS